MNFRQWLLLSESIEANFDAFIEDIKKYAQPNELELKTIQVDDNHKQLIIDALKKVNQEKQEYLKYLLGFLKNKPNALPEDLDRSLDAIKWAITTNKLNKRQIATDGWYNTGKKSNDLIKLRDEASQPSKRQEKREKKQGLAEDLTPIIVSEPYKIYFLPKIKNKELEYYKGEDILESKLVKDRHKLLCKYGKDTGWCTASPSGTYHVSYAHKDIYIVHENDKPVYQFTGCISGIDDNDGHCQFMDIHDNPAQLISEELAEIIMEKLPDIGKFYKAVRLSANINKIENIQDILNIFKIDNINQLEADQILDLLDHSKNQDKMLKLLGTKIIDKIKNKLYTPKDVDVPPNWSLLYKYAKSIIKYDKNINAEELKQILREFYQNTGLDHSLDLLKLILKHKENLSIDDIYKMLIAANVPFDEQEEILGKEKFQELISFYRKKYSNTQT